MPSAFPHASRSRRPSPYNRRLWSLLVALCVVGAMMRHLRQPETVDQLGRVFGLPTESTSEKSQESFEDLDESPQTFDSAQIDRGASLSDAEPRPLVPTSPLAPTNDDAWNLVVDDALFLQQETPAWLETLQQVRDATDEGLRGQSRGELAYAQLRSQPDVYRREVVTISGTALRATREIPTTNDLGIESYWRVVVAPQGGGSWPFVAYCLQLPEKFPRGESISEPVQIDGRFFKNWSYSYGDGFGVAPVVVARTVQWRPHSSKPASTRGVIPPSGRDWATAVLTAALAAATLAAWVARRTRRSSSTPQSPQVDVDDLAIRDAGSGRLAEQLAHWGETHGQDSAP
ncbi:MAG: hypothetical protein KDA61_00950 [Planctomycetales bacterium]|nr:hypothetical protein [Planctomycetales bacterium]